MQRWDDTFILGGLGFQERNHEFRESESFILGSKHDALWHGEHALLYWTVSMFALCFRGKQSVPKIVSKPDFYSNRRYDLHSKDICYTNLWKGRFVQAKVTLLVRCEVTQKTHEQLFPI